MYEYDVFLSFASKDEYIVKILWQELCQNGLRVFWSDSNLKSNIGQSWIDVIQHSLINSEHFILVCTSNSIESEWVKSEYQTFYSQCYIPSKGTRRLALKLEDGFNINSLPPFLKNLQATSSIKEIITLLGGSELQKLRINLEQTQQKLKNIESENGIIKLEFDKLSTGLSKEKLEKAEIKKELDSFKVANYQFYQEIKTLTEKNLKYENEIKNLNSQIERLKSGQNDIAINCNRPQHNPSRISKKQLVQDLMNRDNYKQVPSQGSKQLTLQELLEQNKNKQLTTKNSKTLNELFKQNKK